MTKKLKTGCQKGSHSPPPVIYALTALLAALAGFLAVYVTYGLDGNHGDQGGADQAILREPASALQRPENKGSSKAEGRELKSASRGQMAAFLVWPAARSLPDFIFSSLSGEEKSLSHWKGKVILLNLWATWCAPCRKEMPHLDALKAALSGDDFDVIAISLDRGSFEKTKEFWHKLNPKALNFYKAQSAKLASKLKVIGMPTTLLINRKGEEIGRLTGPADWASEDAYRLIRAAMKEAL